MKQIDINCDLGEGTGNDVALMAYISSCSIACGGHYGTSKTIAKTLALAQNHEVKVGPHPAYFDPDNFGRISLSIPLAELQNALRKQLDLFFDLCPKPHHIKPHGALYNDLFFDHEKADAVTAVFNEYAPGIKLYCPPKSQLAKIGQVKGFQIVYEGFADRTYTGEGSLVPRSVSGAVLTEKGAIANQVLQIVTTKKVKTIEQAILPLNVQTLCLHGDGINIRENLKYLREQLTKNNIRVKAV